MLLFRGIPDHPLPRPVYLAIGNFDGMHCGHQALLHDMTEAAHDAGCLAGAMVFDPHPMAILRPSLPLSFLSTVEERVELATAMGLDFFVILPFDRAVAATTAREFVEALTSRLHIRSLWVGHDFALGKGREGDVPRLTALGAELGFTLHPVSTVELGGQPVHSTGIRELLQRDGDVSSAAMQLGRAYTFAGPVLAGAGRGQKIGYPTANIAVPPGRVVPANGIYACWGWLGDRGIPAAVSVGVRPTFDNGDRSVEAFLIDFDEDVYGRVLGLSFVRRLRAEERYPTVDALRAQIAKDVESTRSILASPRNDRQDGWHEMGHMADWTIDARAPSLGDLFAQTAIATYRLQGNDKLAPITLARRVVAQAEDPGDLLVGWVNALLLAQESFGEMYTRFEVEFISMVGLRAVAYGYAGAPQRTAAKAATYHQLLVEPTGHGWHARLTLDV
jgi:riboflavin kinase / FMN adenylyltransferase